MECTSRIAFIIVVIICSLRENSTALKCFECSDSFKKIWKPDDCQFINESVIPIRECNDQQDYCFVKRVTVKGMVTEITRDCSDDCRYGCEATSFGITKITCVSCCDEDRCNTGNTAHSAPSPQHGLPFILIIFQLFFWSVTSD